jgi:hypothetical protein
VSRNSFSSGGILTRMYNLKWYLIKVLQHIHI